MLFALAGCKYFKKNEYKSLAAADLTALTDLQSEQAKQAIAQSPDQRKEVIKKYGQTYSLAQAAEAEGLDDTEKYKATINMAVSGLIASLLQEKDPGFKPSEQDIDAYGKAHKADFDKTINALIPADKLKDVDDKMKSNFLTKYSDTMLRADKGKSTGIQKDPKYLLIYKFTKAEILAGAYRDKIVDQYKATPEEKKKYIAEHPEADPEKVKQKIQDILTRISKGESFEKIADEVNPDGTKGKGGDLDWFGPGAMVPDFDKAAFALKKGEMTKEPVKTPFGYHLIRVDDERTKKEGDKSVREIKARHILVSTQVATNIDQALFQAYSAPKVKAAMEAAEKKYPVSLPTDFKVNVKINVDPKKDEKKIPELGSK